MFFEIINFLSGLIKLCTGKKVYDVTSGFRAADKDLIKYFAFTYPTDYPEPDSLVQVVKKGYKVVVLAKNGIYKDVMEK